MVWKVTPTGFDEVLSNNALEFLEKLEDIKNRPYGHNDQVKLYYKVLKKLKKEYIKGSPEWVLINNYMKSQPLKEIRLTRKEKWMQKQKKKGVELGESR